MPTNSRFPQWSWCVLRSRLFRRDRAQRNFASLDLGMTEQQTSREYRSDRSCLQVV
jgi:hypothetical protein